MKRLSAFTLLEMMLVLALSGIVILLGYQLFNWTARLEGNHIRQEQANAHVLNFMNKLELVAQKSEVILTTTNGEVSFKLPQTTYQLFAEDSILTFTNGSYTDTLPGQIEEIGLLATPAELVQNVELLIAVNSYWQGYRLEKQYSTEEVIRYENPIQ